MPALPSSSPNTMPESIELTDIAQVQGSRGEIWRQSIWIADGPYVVQSTHC